MSTATLSPLTPRIRHPGVAAVLILFFAGIGVQYTLKVLDPGTRSAFLRWRGQILDLSEGQIGETYNLPNPPIMALVLSPIVQLPPLLGCLTWFYLKVGMALLAVLWIFRMVDNPARPFPAWGKALAIALSLRPIVGDLTHGNVNIFILFLVAGALYAFCRQRDIMAGLLLALAIACKITPALFLPYFVWKQSWKTLMSCAAGLVLFFWLVPGLFLGMDKNAQCLNHWVENMVLPYARGEIWTEHENQSLPATTYRLLTHSPSFIKYVGDIKTPTEYHNVMSLPMEVVPWIIKGCMALFAFLVIWSCRTPLAAGKGEEKRASWRLAAEFSIVVLGMLLFSERTWKHHCVTLLLPFTVLSYYLSAYWPKNRGLVIGILAGAVLLMLLTGTGMGGGQDRFGKLAQAYGAYVWAFILLVIGLVVLLRSKEDGFHPSISETTEPCTRGTGRPRRSVSVVSGSMPNK
jgi:alpha-1,2-mannosyltransferase